MIIAVDTGGTKTLVARFSNSGQLEESEKFPTPKDFAEYVTQTTEKIKAIAGSDDMMAGLAIAVPGDVRNGVALRCPNLGWENVNVHEAFSAQLPGLPITVNNDADIATIGEARLIDPRPRLALYVTFSTGIGTGFAANGQPIPEIYRFEAGKMLVQSEKELVPWESIASGRAIYEKYGRFARDITDETMWRDIAHDMAYGISNLVAMFEPEYLIIGGSVGTYFDRYAAFLQETIEQQIPTYAPKTTIIQAKHPEEAVIYGCYQAAIDQLNS